MFYRLPATGVVVCSGSDTCVVLARVGEVSVAVDNNSTLWCINTLVVVNLYRLVFSVGT